MQTVISVFDNRDTAQRALTRLVQGGFARQDVHVREQAPGEAGDGLPAEADHRLLDSRSRVADESGPLHALGRFFTSLFGVDGPNAGHSDVYSEAVRRGNTVVVVDAADEEQASRAVELLHDLGALDVHEQARGWGVPSNTPGHRMDRGGVRVFMRASNRPLRDEVAETH